jgi:ribosomal protein L21
MPLSKKRSIFIQLTSLAQPLLCCSSSNLHPIFTQGGRQVQTEEDRMKKSEKKSESGKDAIKVNGIIVAMEWDEDGKAVAVAVSTDQEQELVIDQRNKKGQELKKLLRRKVEVTGRISGTQMNRKVIVVRKYSVIEEKISSHSKDEIVKFKESRV